MSHDNMNGQLLSRGHKLVMGSILHEDQIEKKKVQLFHADPA